MYVPRTLWNLFVFLNIIFKIMKTEKSIKNGDYLKDWIDSQLKCISTFALLMWIISLFSPLKISWNKTCYAKIPRQEIATRHEQNTSSLSIITKMQSTLSVLRRKDIQRFIQHHWKSAHVNPKWEEPKWSTTETYRRQALRLFSLCPTHLWKICLNVYQIQKENIWKE